jgi:hypothetical protein
MQHIVSDLLYKDNCADDYNEIETRQKIFSLFMIRKRNFVNKSIP